MKNIAGTDEAWDSRQLGASVAHAKVAEAADIRLHMQDGKLSGEEA